MFNINKTVPHDVHCPNDIFLDFHIGCTTGPGSATSNGKVNSLFFLNT